MNNIVWLHIHSLNKTLQVSLKRARQWSVAVFLVSVLALPLYAQSAGSIRGTVSYEQTGTELHNASVVLLELGRATTSAEDGSYTFENVPAGNYHLMAHMDSLFTEAAKTVTVAQDHVTIADFQLSITKDQYEVTVTASEKHEHSFDSFNSVESLNTLDLTSIQDVSLGEALHHQVGTGIAKRGFGPGPSRPIIRGFDGDRVLIMEDGIRTGTLSSSSGDHGEMIQIGQIERLEIVKGPATLLYSGNAIGGTVNAISRHHEIHSHPHQGLRGFLTGSGGTANSLANGNAGFEYGKGNWMLWLTAAGTHSGDYSTPEGPIFNSRTRMQNGSGGFGWYSENMYFSASMKIDKGRYGIPFAHELHGESDHHEMNEDEEEAEHEEDIERVSLDSTRQGYRLTLGYRNPAYLKPVENINIKLSYTRWNHKELEFLSENESEVATTFDNNQSVYRALFDQRKKGPWSGRFGIWGINRDYSAMGEEALSPPINQTGFALFALEEVDLEQVKFQFGARLERQSYNPLSAKRGESYGHAEEDAAEFAFDNNHADEVIPAAIKRTFSGVSASAGIHTDLWKNGVFVANISHSYRPPALEELYNYGPHVGTLAFEVGNPSLQAESGNGFDFSLRHSNKNIKGEVNFFQYNFADFIFPFATGEVAANFQVIEFTRLDARYIGTEANLDIGIHPDLWLNLGLDYVDARSTATNTPLPRIPPMRTKLGFHLNHKCIEIHPELILAGAQHNTFNNELPTSGYSVMNLKASCTHAQPHVAHQFAVNVFNIGDKLYRNHSSYIKDLAPEMGRGVRITYTMRFF